MQLFHTTLFDVVEPASYRSFFISPFFLQPCIVGLCRIDLDCATSTHNVDFPCSVNRVNINQIENINIVLACDLTRV